MIYLHSFSIGSIIGSLFFAIIAFFLLSVKNRSRATFHLGMAFAIMSTFNLGYVISSSIYHPLAAYHRWITVLTILLAICHSNAFYFFYPTEVSRRGAKIFLTLTYALSIAVTLVFVFISLKSEKIYHFRGHYWDFDAEKISKIVAIVIMLYIAINIILCLWRIFTSDKKYRTALILLVITFIFASVIPSIANTLSRDGAISREFFHNTWVIFNVLGFFLLAVVYLNNTSEKISFMGKLIGISLVTMLVLLQFAGFIFMKDSDRAYDEIHRRSARFIMRSGTPEYGARYLVEYDTDKNNFRRVFGKKVPHPDTLRDQCTAAMLCHRISRLSPENFREKLDTILDGFPPIFQGHRETITHFVQNMKDTKDPAAAAVNFINSMNSRLLVQSNKIRQIPGDGFKKSLESFLEKKAKNIETFMPPIVKRLQSSTKQGNDLKKEVLRYLTLMLPPATRIYHSAGKEHLISFIQAASETSSLYVTGFPYTDYRRYIHPTVVNLLIMLAVIVLFVRFGFQFLFANVLVNPLRSLSRGVRQVNEGNLNIEIPVKIDDEIGYITRTFNNMVASLRGMVETISMNSVDVKEISTDLNTSSTDLSDIARELAAVIEETAGAYEEMAASFESNLNDIEVQLKSSDDIKMDIANINSSSKQLSGRISDLGSSIQGAVGMVETGEKTMNKSVKSIQDMAEYLHELEGAINEINEVADKINLLALNAAIEASRAGDAGRGFSVVADEVNKLADQTAELSSGIRTTIAEHTERINRELSFISDTAGIFNDIREKIMETRDVLAGTIEFTGELDTMNSDIKEKIEKLSTIASSIYSYSREQKNTINELTNSINTINSISQKTLESSDMVQSYARIIKLSSKTLSENVETFKITAGENTPPGKENDDRPSAPEETETENEE